MFALKHFCFYVCFVLCGWLYLYYYTNRAEMRKADCQHDMIHIFIFAFITNRTNEFFVGVYHDAIPLSNCYR